MTGRGGGGEGRRADRVEEEKDRERTGQEGRAESQKVSTNEWSYFYFT